MDIDDVLADDAPLAIDLPGAAHVDRRSFSTLRPGCWLNDEVMNAYLEILRRRGGRCTVLGTHFYSTIETTNGYNVDAAARQARSIDHGAMRLLVPVHLGAHWVLVLVDIAAECVLYYDSLGGYKQRVVDVLRGWCREHMGCVDADWWLSIRAHAPRQENTWDCGVFVLAMAERLMAAEPFEFTQGDMPNMRRRIARAILDQ